MKKLFFLFSISFSLLSATPLPPEWEQIELIGTSEPFTEMREAQISRFLRISYSPGLERVIVAPSEEGGTSWLARALLLKIADEGLRDRYTKISEDGKTLTWHTPKAQ